LAREVVPKRGFGTFGDLFGGFFKPGSSCSMLVVEALKECQRFLSQKGSQASPTAYPIHKTNCLCRFDFLLASPRSFELKAFP